MNINKNILVVDDEPYILDAIELVLTMEGYTVRTATNSKTIKKINNKYQPDLILLDVLLSGEDGRDIAKSLKKDTKYKSVPIVMMSAHPSAEKTVRECGVEDFLAKPFDMNDLLGKIRKHTK